MLAKKRIRHTPHDNAQTLFFNPKRIKKMNTMKHTNLNNNSFTSEPLANIKQTVHESSATESFIGFFAGILAGFIAGFTFGFFADTSTLIEIYEQAAAKTAKIDNSATEFKAGIDAIAEAYDITPDEVLDFAETIDIIEAGKASLHNN